ncbi:A/G-specific adenine glycosylase [Candidatus Poriferisodalis sp.]|uniref:A/G-specific adenine glycosylase n=1 Tax=Candidatus Poriferisodalis sp. TaxID=3101277 RepID=UPI003B5BCEFA
MRHAELIARGLRHAELIARGLRHAELSRWWAAERRGLPWRRTRDPWLVLVSEVMLQQTQVERVLPYYETFAERWPTPQHCAEAVLSDVLAAWQGLGYPRRARNLWRTATLISERHGGTVPAGLDDLLALPGVGPYTARAVQAFAFGIDTGVVDTNVGRILARWAGQRLSPTQAQQMADELVPAGEGWSWNQAMMDLGNRICTKRTPRCGNCPVRKWCAWAGFNGPDPADRSAGVSTRQAPYEGSDRQARGRLLAALSEREVARAQGPVAMGLERDKARAQRLLDELITEGLITADGEQLRLG